MRHSLIFFVAGLLVAAGAISFSRHQRGPVPYPATILADGGRYEGTLREGLLEGTGRIVWPDGSEYRGDFSAGRFDGQGMLRYADGAVYEGAFAEGRLQGRGRYRFEDGSVYEGHFSDDDLNGPGRYSDGSGLRYEGEFAHWAYSGHGVYHFPNGDRYEGRFSDGLFDGPGTLYYAEPVDGRNDIRGLWRDGELQTADDPADWPDAALGNETALYRQQALLESQWSALEPGDPDRIELYFLGVAGDGQQGVFRRELLYVRDRFERDYGTQGHSVVLINDRSTVDEFPLATRTSIRRSLEQLASRMDAAQDILFVYLSSHGSDDFEFSLEQPQMSLPDLSADELAGMLGNLPVQWKVVVISACYSGGFIPKLEDARTLVITSAAPDRTSFGCEDNNRFTYFGEAYFKDALPQTGDFSSAFDLAERLVTEREQAQGYDPSRPQISRPAAIMQQLEAWRRSGQARANAPIPPADASQSGS